MAKVEGIDTLHSLRHSYVTILAAEGFTGAALRLIIGHATAGKVLEEEYAHETLSTREKAAEAMSKFIG